MAGINIVYVTGCGKPVELRTVSPFVPTGPIHEMICPTQAAAHVKSVTELAATCKACGYGRADVAPTTPVSVTTPTMAVPAPTAAPTAVVSTAEAQTATPTTPAAAPRELPPFVPSTSPAPQAQEVFMTQEELAGRFPPLFPTDDTPRTPVEELLEAAFPSYTRGGSLMGWSKLKTAKLCLRMFFWDYVMALVLKPAVRLKQERDDDRPKRVNPLALGTVVHACIENMYRAGSISEAFAPCEVIKAQHPDVALEARRLVQFYIDTYNADEVARWDLRAVERESRYYFPARKVQGKRRSLCVSCRHDGIYREMQPGDGHLPRGARADGVHLHEVKTTASLTAGRLRQFFQNAQLQMQLLCYNHGLAVKRTGDVLAVSNADIIGPAIAVTVTEIGKQKRQDPNLDMARPTFYIPEERVLAFRDDIADWYHEEVADRLFHEAWQDARTWRKDWQCFDLLFPSWSCPYLSLCEAGDDVDWTTSYEQRVGEGLLPEQLELPPKLAKVKRVRAAAAPTGEGK